MLCPLKFTANTTDDDMVHVSSISPHCEKEKCALWLEDVSMCAIKQLALDLRYAQFKLQDIPKKED